MSQALKKSAAPPPLMVENLGFSFPGNGFSLEGVEFAVRAGDLCGLIGPNGSGKSTLLSLAAGQKKPGSGQVLVHGRNTASMNPRERARQIGYLPQEVLAHMEFTAFEVAAMGRYPHLSGAGFLSEEDLLIVKQSLTQTGVDHLAERPFSTLSGGEKQRTLLSSILAQKPRVLLLDEPTSAMDLDHQARFFGLLTQLGLPVLVVTHDLNLASVFCNRLVLLKGGRIQTQGDPRQVLTRDLLSRVYGDNVVVTRHPEMDRPVVLPGSGPALKSGIKPIKEGP